MNLVLYIFTVFNLITFFLIWRYVYNFEIMISEVLELIHETIKLINEKKMKDINNEEKKD